MQYTIRPAITADIPALESLIEVSARQLSVDSYDEDEINAAITHVFGVDSELVADGTYFLVESDQNILACGGWSRRKTLFGGDRYHARQSGLLDPASEPAKIRAFFVHPDYARRGIGRALLTHCEAEALRHGFSCVEMMATLPGVKLYAASGYVPQDQVLHHVPNGATVRFVPMVKALT